MNALATTLIRLSTASSLVLLALPVTTVTVSANPVSINWDALEQAGQTNAPIVLNPSKAEAPTSSAPQKTKTFKLTAPKLLNPKNKTAGASPSPKARPSKKPEDLRTSDSQPTRAPQPPAVKQKAPTTVSAQKKTPVKKTTSVASKPTPPATPNVPSSDAANTTARAAPTKRIPTKLPAAQATAKKAPARRPSHAQTMQEYAHTLSTPRAQTDAHWGAEPKDKILPAAPTQSFAVATFGSEKRVKTPPSAQAIAPTSTPAKAATKPAPQKEPQQSASVSRPPAPARPAEAAPAKPTKPAASIIATSPAAPRSAPVDTFEATARELAAIEDAPSSPKTLRSPEPAEGRIVFDVDSAQLMTSGRSTLAAVAKKLNQTAARIQLKAYTSQSTLTSVSAQRRLSLKRAMAVRQHLTTEFGISSSRIDVRVLGTVEDSGPGDRVDIVMTSS
ncbi:MAG: OmpA family protein [Parvibaculaceae bacterium]|nr:OmpA family protein [Parvibaculaceae bacterium]